MQRSKGHPIRALLGYLSLPRMKGTPQVGGNRQFQYFSNPTFVYPCVMAWAATLLKNAGHEVLWMDGPAQQLTWDDCLRAIAHAQPTLIAFEAKTPVIKDYWRLSYKIRLAAPGSTLVLVGDHVSALPEETLDSSCFNAVVVGGDYDVALKHIADELASDGRPRGIIKQAPDSNMDSLPIINRDLTRWEDYAYQNGNFKHTPGTYTYVGRDCWWRKDGGCSFCSWTGIHPAFRVQSPSRWMDEVESCVAIGAREIFDDTGTFPTGEWLWKACDKLIKANYPIKFGCNMRPGVLKAEDYFMLKRAGFRWILYGLESANQMTLDRIGKGIKCDDILHDLKMAKENGIDTHVTAMVGYPWEIKESADETVKLCRNLFSKGLIDSLQASILIPYPGTRMYNELVATKGFRVPPGEWEHWDMSRSVCNSLMTNEEIMDSVRKLYLSCLSPKYLLKKVVTIRSADDLAWLWKAAKAVVHHVLDFKRREDFDEWNIELGKYPSEN